MKCEIRYRLFECRARENCEFKDIESSRCGDFYTNHFGYSGEILSYAIKLAPFSTIYEIEVSKRKKIRVVEDGYFNYCARGCGAVDFLKIDEQVLVEDGKMDTKETIIDG